MYYSVVSAKHAGGYRLVLRFADGSEGTADLGKYVRRGGVFDKLKDEQIFAAFRINEDFGTICWGDDLDIAPESLYEQVVGRRDTTATPVAMVAEGKAKYGT